MNRIVIRGQTLAEIEAAKIPYLEQFPELVDDERWDVQELPPEYGAGLLATGLLASAVTNQPIRGTPGWKPPAPLMTKPPKPARKPPRQPLYGYSNPLLPAAAPDPGPPAPPPAVVLHASVEARLRELDSTVRRLSARIDDLEGRVSIDNVHADFIGDKPEWLT